MQNTATVIPFKSQDDVLLNKLNRYVELKELVKEYESIKRSLKKSFEGQYEKFIGSYKITGKEVIRKAYNVDETIYWDMRIKKI